MKLGHRFNQKSGENAPLVLIVLGFWVGAGTLLYKSQQGSENSAKEPQKNPVAQYNIDNIGHIPAPPKWKKMEARQDVAMKDPAKAQEYRAWLDENLSKYKSASFKEKAMAVDKLVDEHLTYVDDIVLYNVKDYLASPYESFINKQGDCDDYAILKYDILINYFHVPKEKCLVASVHANGGLHAVTLLNDSLDGKDPSRYFILDINDGNGEISPPYSNDITGYIMTFCHDKGIDVFNESNKPKPPRP